MNKASSIGAAALLALACLAVSLTAQVTAPAPAQAKPVDMKKLIAEIAGEYEFSVQGQVLIVQFAEQDGKLFGAPPGSTPEEIHPLEGKPLFFDVTLAETGDYYELQFVRNDKGIIDKCLLTAQGMVIEGLKVIKSPATD